MRSFGTNVNTVTYKTYEHKPFADIGRLPYWAPSALLNHKEDESNCARKWFLGATVSEGLQSLRTGVRRQRLGAAMNKTAIYGIIGGIAWFVFGILVGHYAW